MIDLNFFQYLKDIAMATNFVTKLPTPLTLIALLFRNEMGNHYLNVCINSVNDVSTLCLKK